MSKKEKLQKENETMRKHLLVLHIFTVGPMPLQGRSFAEFARQFPTTRGRVE